MDNCKHCERELVDMECPNIVMDDESQECENPTRWCNMCINWYDDDLDCKCNEIGYR